MDQAKRLLSVTGVRVALGLAAAVAVAVGVIAARSRSRFDMVADLALRAQREGVWDNQWDQVTEKIASLSTALSAEKDPGARFRLRREIARHYVYGGAVEGALTILEEMQGEIGKTLPPDVAEAVKSDLAFAYFRLGEVQNCASNHNANSCLFPIQGDGVHRHRLGATEAVKLYGELLADPGTDPENALAYRWLLNIAYMTLGQYPEQVPKRWLIPPEAFASDADIGRFPDVAANRGLSEFGVAGGLVLEDFDNDGYPDVMISHMGIRDQLQYFHNDGHGAFTRMTKEAGLEGITGGLNMVQADYDNDGCIDVLVLRGAWLHDHGRFPSSLLHNNCDGTFTDVTAQAGVLNDYPTQTATWADFDNDGLLDLFIGYEIDREHVQWPESARNFALYLNNGDGTFREVGAESGIRLDGMVKAVVSGDYDNDGRQDIYVSVLGRPNHLFRNVGMRGGVPRFEDVTAKAGVGEPLMSFTAWFWDYDNDGWPDIFVSGYSASLPDIVRETLGDKEHAKGERPRLYHNNRDGTFTDVSREARLDKLLLTMGANYGDLDNDGYLDFYLGTGNPAFTTLAPNRMFRNDRGRSFQDVTTSGGFGNLQKGHAVAFGDVDGTGNQDIIEVMGGAYSGDRFWTSFYKNPGHGNHWVKLRLEGVQANRFAVGGRIRLVVAEAGGVSREIFGLVGSGGSFGANSVRPHLGLGQAKAIDLLEIRWPGSGRLQQFKGPLAVDRTYEIREGRDEVKEVGSRAAQAAKP
jgi:hypothetical protein